MGEVVAGEAAVELGEPARDLIAMLPRDAIDHPVDLADAVVATLDRGERVVVERVRGPDRAVAEHGGQRPHVVACLAVKAGALATGVGRDHAADRGTVRGAEFGGEEQAVRPQRRIELVLDHAGLDPHAAVRDVDLEDAVHVAREVDHDARGERLTVGPGAAAARCQDHGAKAVFGEQPGDAGHVVGAAWEQDRLRRQAVDRIVGREDHPVSVRGRHVAREPGTRQRGEQPGHGLVGPRGFGKPRDHDGPPVSSLTHTIVTAPRSLVEERCRWPPICRPRHVNASPPWSDSEVGPGRRILGR